MQRGQGDKREQVRSYPAALWPWSGWCGHLRWGNPERDISCTINLKMTLGGYVSLCIIDRLTCSNLIFTVKSPASKLSRMRL